MTKEEAKIILLEQALFQAILTIEFLDSCLLSPNFYYSHPEQTQDLLKEFKKLVKKKELCIHSEFVPDCKSCNQRIEERNKREEALKILTKE